MRGVRLVAVAGIAVGQASLTGCVVVRPARLARASLHVHTLGALSTRSVAGALRAISVLYLPAESGLLRGLALDVSLRLLRRVRSGSHMGGGRVRSIRWSWYWGVFVAKGIPDAIKASAIGR